MKLLVACIFILGIVGFIPAEDKLVVRSCEGFDFGIQETNWILFPQGRDSSFRSGDQTFELIAEYQITEPYILEYERHAIFAFFQMVLLATATAPLGRLTTPKTNRSRFITPSDIAIRKRELPHMLS